MTELTTRPIVFHDLPLPDTVVITSPEQFILGFGGAGSLDVGSLCYLRRGSNQRNAPKDSIPVMLSSFCHLRARYVRALITLISDDFSHSGKKAGTLITTFHRFCCHFMAWTDSNGHSELFKDEESAHRALYEYIQHLKLKMTQNVISANYAAKLRQMSITVVGGLLGLELDRGQPVIKRRAQASENTVPPCEDSQSRTLALAEAMFNGLSDLVVNGKPYPFRLDMPKYLNWPENCLWVFPLNMWCIPPQRMFKHRGIDAYRAYDYTNGRLVSLEEIDRLYPGHHFRGSTINAQKRLTSANQNLRDYARLHVAVRAVNAFVMLFIANTGMNLVQAINLQWNDEFEYCAERQGFRTIKWRAGNKICHFEISTSFVHLFKRYLKLRRYLLDGMACDLLFFSLDEVKVKMPKKLGFYAIKKLYQRTLRHFDPEIPNISSREWRAAKCDWLIRNTDPSTAAKVLQNSEKTVLKHYAAGSKTSHRNEMGKFFSRIAEIVIDKKESAGSEVERAVGTCSEPGEPRHIKGPVQVILNCHDPEGCLFCDKFRVHVNERDTRKLLSCHYCLQRSSHLVTSEEQYQSMFVPIFQRIEEIVQEIRLRDEGMVARIESEIEAGDLDTFWANKLEMLVELELVI